MNAASIPMAVILCFCAAVFAAVGCWAAMRRDPMHFWAGSTVKPEEIRDIPAYNRACARLWWGYGAAWALVGALALSAPAAAGIAAAALSVGGLGALIGIYRYIYKKYKR